MSLDGFIVGPKGECHWIAMDPEVDFAAFFKEFDTVLALHWLAASRQQDLVERGHRALLHPALCRRLTPGCCFTLTILMSSFARFHTLSEPTYRLY